jgi:hypothetical protein
MGCQSRSSKRGIVSTFYSRSIDPLCVCTVRFLPQRLASSSSEGQQDETINNNPNAIRLSSADDVGEFILISSPSFSLFSPYFCS